MDLSIEPLQTDEVVKALTESRWCTLVCPTSGTGNPVDIDFVVGNEHAPWRIIYLCEEIPEKSFLKEVLALGFELRAWPDSSSPVYELTRSCFGIRAAAIKALIFTRMLPGVPEDAWLWLTINDQDQREDPPPKPPSPWPPAA